MADESLEGIDLDEVREIQRFDPEYRRAHIGASEWPAICGLSPFRTPIDVWTSKVGGEEGDVSSEAIDLGRDLESGILTNLVRRIGVSLVRDRQVTHEHPTQRHLCATPDGELVDGDLAEIKVSGWFGRPASIMDWGEPGTDEVPEHVMAQVQAAMHVTRAARLASVSGLDGPARCHVGAFLPRRGVCIYTVAYDEDLARMLEERVDAFWRHVQTGEPPPPDASDGYLRHLAKRYPQPSKAKWIESDALTDALALDYRAAKDAAEAADKALTLARNRMCERIGDAEGIVGPWGRVRWGYVRGRAQLRIDRARDLLIASIGEERAEQIMRSCMVTTLDKAQLETAIRGAVTKTKTEASKLIEHASERGAGHRALKTEWNDNPKTEARHDD